MRHLARAEASCAPRAYDGEPERKPLRVPARHAACRHLVGSAVCCGLLVLLYFYLHPVDTESPVARNAEPQRRRSFARIAELDSDAASGLAAFMDAEGTSYVAIANYYGDSALYEFQPISNSLRKLQTFLSAQAHDWEVVRLADGSTQLFLAETGADRSYIYQLNDSAASARALPDKPVYACADSPDAAASCRGWSSSGECERNPAFMHAACAASCGLCERLRGPLVALQQLPVDHASAARHFYVGHRLFLGVAERSQVSFYEWAHLSTAAAASHDSAEGKGGPWHLFDAIPVAGFCELAHMRLASGTHLVALAKVRVARRGTTRALLGSPTILTGTGRATLRLSRSALLTSSAPQCSSRSNTSSSPHLSLSPSLSLHTHTHRLFTSSPSRSLSSCLLTPPPHAFSLRRLLMPSPYAFSLRRLRSGTRESPSSATASSISSRSTSLTRPSS